MRVEFRNLTTQQRAVFATVSHYYEAIGEPVPASYVARRLSITRQRVGAIFMSLNRYGWLRSPGAPAVPVRHLPACEPLTIEQLPKSK